MMAQRKDMMRIIRQDAGFSAKLGFGENAGASELADPLIPVPPTSVDALAAPSSSTPALAAVALPSGKIGEVSVRPFGPKEEPREEKKAFGAQKAQDAKANGISSGSAARGQVVHVSLSLTIPQARLAEEWATAARCTVQFLIRRVAQGLRDQVFDDWERDGMPRVEESRGARGKHPTSVTLTLRPQFAADL
ncbi:MAG: hypothetical protein EAZ40_01945, partial [Rhodobacterales bacterium]